MFNNKLLSITLQVFLLELLKCKKINANTLKKRTIEDSISMTILVPVPYTARTKPMIGRS